MYTYGLVACKSSYVGILLSGREWLVNKHSLADRVLFLSDEELKRHFMAERSSLQSLRVKESQHPQEGKARRHREKN